MANNLLLVDESPLIHRVVELTFEGHDISVYSADDAEEALALARSLKPDIVIASTHIKRSDGLEFCRELRDDIGLAHTPVLLLAGAKENLSTEQAREAGAIGVLTKPFNPESLLAQVGLALSWTPSSNGEETAGGVEFDDPDLSSGIPAQETEELNAFIDEAQSSPLEEITGDDIGGENALDEPDTLADLPDERDELDALADLPGEQGEELAEKAEDLPGEGDAPSALEDSEEDIPDPPPLGKDMSAEMTSGPPEESSSQEEEEVYRDIDIEDLFEDYHADAESGAIEAVPAQADEPSPQEGEESAAPSTEDTDDFEDADMKAAEDELDSLQAELSADLEEIGGTHFEEDRVREAEEELASLEAELAMEEEVEETPPEETEDVELDQGSADIEIPSSVEETDLGADLADEIFQDEETELRGKLVEESDLAPPSESPESQAMLSEAEAQSEIDEPLGEADDLAALLDETDFGPELDIPLEPPAGEGMPALDEPSAEDTFDADELLDTGITPPPAIDNGPDNGDELLAPEIPIGSDQDENAFEPLVEQSLEKAVEAIVPAILHRIESIIVDRLPDVVEKIVLREIEKIKRGE